MKSVYEKLKDGDYKNKLPYPTSASTIALRILRGAVGAENIPVLEGPARALALQAYNAESRQLEAQFKADALEEVGLTGHPKADAVYALAWDYGRASGFSEVMNCLRELADLVKP
jgi:hypothetical protein